MATFSGAQAIYGLSATSQPTSTNVSGAVSIGVAQTAVRFADATSAFSFRIILANAANVADVSFVDGDTAGSTAWTAGVAQVETATCAGTISTAGTAAVVVTAAGMTGSPKTINVAVALSDTANAWAAKVRAALTADADVSAMFTVSGATDKVILTRKPAVTTTSPELINFYAANDTSLNISLANGTCAGITTAATSANTTAGVLTDGAKFYDADGKDWEGVTLTPISEVFAMLIENGSALGGNFTLTNVEGDSFEIVEGGQGMLYYCKAAASARFCGSVQTFTALSSACEIIVTVIGK